MTRDTRHQRKRDARRQGTEDRSKLWGLESDLWPLRSCFLLCLVSRVSCLVSLRSVSCLSWDQAAEHPSALARQPRPAEFRESGLELRPGQHGQAALLLEDGH